MSKQTAVKNPSPVVRVLAAGAVAASLAIVTGCNTVEGVGEDVEAAGDAVADTARDAND
ncbi:MAG: entericidin A/B family lipoprotein [Phycisphaerales bacterium JB041]